MQEIGVASQLNIVGDAFYFDVTPFDGPYQVYQGVLANPGGARAALTVPRQQNVKAWVGTRAGLHWTDGHSIRLRTGPVE